jgi:hypothetical protein
MKEQEKGDKMSTDGSCRSSNLRNANLILTEKALASRFVAKQEL